MSKAERYNPLVELTLSRFREFVREPEAVFWVFAFPVIMTCALGIAFRSRGAEPVIAGVVEQAGANAVAAALEQAGGFTVRRVPPDEVESALRDGRAPVVIVPGTPPTYRYDEARAETVDRIADHEDDGGAGDVVERDDRRDIADRPAVLFHQRGEIDARPIETEAPAEGGDEISKEDDLPAVIRRSFARARLDLPRR